VPVPAVRHPLTHDSWLPIMPRSDWQVASRRSSLASPGPPGGAKSLGFHAFTFRFSGRVDPVVVVQLTFSPPVPCSTIHHTSPCISPLLRLCQVKSLSLPRCSITFPIVAVAVAQGTVVHDAVLVACIPCPTNGKDSAGDQD
jgi:hypothetical protein